MLDSVRELPPVGDSIILLAKMGFATDCLMVRIGASLTDDVFEDKVDGSLPNAGVDGGSG
jgi:hypothetical protein